MKMQQFSCPLAPALAVFCFPHQNPIFLKDQNMKKYQHYIDVREEDLPTAGMHMILSLQV